MGIVGRNGAGKTTLLKILARITAPTSGVARVRGRLASLLEVGTGFHPELTGRDNVLLSGTLLGMSRREIAARLDEIVEFSEVGKYLDTPVKRYSSGMYVRLAFSVAAHLSAEVLLLDEVLAVGDVEFQRKCRAHIRSLAEDEGRTILFVSHNLAAVSELCPRTLLLDQGALAANDSTSEVLRSYVQGLGSRDPGVDVSDPGLRSQASLVDSLFKWVGVEVRGIDGEILPEVPFGQPFEVSLVGEASADCQDLLIGLAVVSNIRGVILTTHQAYSGLPTSYAKGRHEFRVLFDPNLLAPGAYDLTVDVLGPMVRDQIPAALELSIIDVGAGTRGIWAVPGRDGILDAPCSWDHSRC
jgi:lipopolysaccharide transport system ATP-binding protein